MKEYMVELYVSRADPRAVERAAQLTKRAAEQMSRLGTPVRFLRSIYVAEDETCFFLYAAESAEAVREAARATGRPFEHVVEIIEEPVTS
jgi:Nickel responsive protein SCO4226-like